MTDPPPDPLAVLPAELRTRLGRIMARMPVSWRVIEIRKDASGDWVVKIVDEAGQVAAYVALREAEGDSKR